jgi:hypothetical protein
VHADGPARDRCGVEVGLQPRGAADPRARRLEMAVEVVHAEQAQLHHSSRLVRGRRRAGVGVEAEQGHRHCRGEGCDSGQQSGHARHAKSLQFDGCYEF